MRRRDFIKAIVGSTIACPLAANAHSTGEVRRIGVLMYSNLQDAEAHERLAAFENRLRLLGWDNLQIDYRWGDGDLNRILAYGAELVALAPDVLLGTNAATTEALQKATNAIPVVFVQVADPVASGFVKSLARPGGNLTGFTHFEYPIAGKWLEMLKEIAPS